MRAGRRLYILLAAAAAAALLVFTVFEYYSLGVVKKYNKSQYISKTIAEIEENFTDNNKFFEDFRTEYNSKTRTVSLVLRNVDNILNESYLEELRIATNSSMISVSDREGRLVAGTDPAADGEYVREAFLSHTRDTVYTDSILINDKDSPVIVSATARPDKRGLIQITYPADSLIEKLYNTDNYFTFAKAEEVTEGIFAIVNADSMLIENCSDRELEGRNLDLDAERFAEDSGKFSADFQGRASLIQYKRMTDEGEEHIIFAAVPKSNIYKGRKTAVLWTVFGAAAVSFVLILTFRKQLLNGREENIGSEEKMEIKTERKAGSSDNG